MPFAIVKDWNKVDFTNAEHRKKVFGALQHFVNFHRTPEARSAMQHFATTGDFPAKVKELIERFRLEDYVDNAWEGFFAMRDYTGSTASGFKIRDVSNGLTFKLTPEGMNAQIHKFAGVETEVGFSMYSGGLGWSRQLIDDRDFWTLEDNAAAFRNKYLKLRAETGVALIEAISSGQNTTWQAPTPAALGTTDARYTASRDVNTINSACLSILTDLKDAGMDVGPNTVFRILAPVALRARIAAALSVLMNGQSGGPLAVQFNVVPSYTLMLSSNSYYYVGVPGLKAIWGDRMNLSVFDKFDIETYSDVAVGWARFGAAIGDENQFRRCAIA